MPKSLIVSDPRTLNGTPVIAGTQVPVRMLIEYRNAGQPLYEFLFDFPAVKRAQAKKLWAWLAAHSPVEIEAALTAATKPPSPHGGQT